MKLYTKTGDDGTTGLVGGQRVEKNSPRVEACGAVDELNSSLGVAAAVCGHEELSAILSVVQNRLFDVGAELATVTLDPAAGQATESGDIPKIGPDQIAQAEGWIDTLCGSLPPLKRFILPGGCELAARLHAGRAVCRRAERRCVALSGQEPVRGGVLVYLNRLSDLLFAMARRANQLDGSRDVQWNRLEPG